ncbi:unnamed protein product [Heterobilharzia americana]|nr:unnamed protein product [Heterobilharzia americana]
MAIAAISFAYHALYLIYPSCDPRRMLIISLSVLAITFLTWVNVMKVSWAITIQNVFASAKVLALIGIILSGLVVVCQAMLYLRRYQPEIPRPLRLPVIIPVIFLLACVFLSVLSLVDKPTEMLIGIGSF